MFKDCHRRLGSAHLLIQEQGKTEHVWDFAIETLTHERQPEGCKVKIKLCDGRTHATENVPWSLKYFAFPSLFPQW